MRKKGFKNAWLQRQDKDPYVKEAQAKGYRSRASFKLLELHQKDRLFKPNMTVVDLGAAPGGWSQVLLQLVGKHGKVIALDLLEITPIKGLDIIQGDFTEESVFVALQEKVGNQIDWVVSDMAPNLSGNWAQDHPKSMYLIENALEFAKSALTDGGGFLVKAFQGEGIDDFIKELRKQFKQVKIRKPDASRSESREIYLLATGYNI